jgi:hypothetical protein
MSNKSSRSNSGEEPNQPAHRRENSVDADDVRKNSGSFQPSQGAGNQENQKNRGYEEDQPGQPVRNTAGRDDQKNTPAGEPEEEEQKS